MQLPNLKNTRDGAVRDLKQISELQQKAIGRYLYYNSRFTNCICLCIEYIYTGFTLFGLYVLLPYFVS